MEKGGSWWMLRARDAGILLVPKILDGVCPQQITEQTVTSWFTEAIKL
jgi:hypothetical protein